MHVRLLKCSPDRTVSAESLDAAEYLTLSLTIIIIGRSWSTWPVFGEHILPNCRERVLTLSRLY